MTYEQIIIFSLIILVLIGLLWGKWRYDLVAFCALIAGVALGAVPPENAFSGFGHEATIIVALVLIISTGLMRSGAVDLISRAVIDSSRSLGAHIAIFGTFGGMLSAFMNNVAALALLMPIDIAAAKQAGRPLARSLMPLSFATILGGMATLIGTPPNIIIASYRNEAMGEPFMMFDFAPVGLAIAIIGMIFIATIGWRLIPIRNGNKDAMEDLLAIEDYVVEMIVSEKSPSIGKKVRDLDGIIEENDCAILGLIRRNERLPARARRETIKNGDILIVQGTPDNISKLSGVLKLKLQGKAGQIADLSSDMQLSEVVVSKDSPMIGRSANKVQMLRIFGVSLVGLSRMGRIRRERIRRTPIKGGDILLLLGTEEGIRELSARLELLPLNVRPLSIIRHEKAWGAIAMFAGAIILAAMGVFSLPIVLSMVAIGFVLFDILPLREIYKSIEWPVIVLLGSMIPLGAALESSGGTVIIANWLAFITDGLPAWAAIAIILVSTMTLSDVLNNTATAVIAAPIAIELAKTLNASIDPFLMAVAVGASCAFLTPIGHKNNLLILGPGGYRFGDYWRMGLPLEIIVTIVAVPTILFIWPL